MDIKSVPTTAATIMLKKSNENTKSVALQLINSLPLPPIAPPPITSSPTNDKGQILDIIA